MCGEKPFAIREPAPSIGSPPRVRGKGIEKGVSEARIRITPACAGKRLLLIMAWICVKDHPRVCGEKYISCALKYQPPGSPPRVRGKGQECKLLVGRLGITPACAGKSINAGSILPHAEDHPRVCGEKTHGLLMISSVSGSPPRVRGKVPLPRR